MRYRVEITEEPKYDVMIEDLPQAKTGMQVNYSLYNKLAAIGGADMKTSSPERQATKTITKVPREAANLEAEGGETVLTFDPSGYPLFYTIKGPRHHSGGVPLNLPDDSFIFSDTKEMIVRDCTILKMFSKPCGKKGYTPADLSKQFDINKYRNVLQDPNSDEITRRTAESMIKKYVIKLGALALAQEAKKGFPQGIPVVAKAYMDAYGISEDDLMPQDPMQQAQGQMSPTDQMPPDQYAQEPQPDQMQNASPDQMDEAQMQQMMAQQQQGQMPPQEQGVPEGAATPEMVEPMMQQMDQQAPPMAMYGMAMGGFYPEFAFGGYPRFDGGGVTVNNIPATRGTGAPTGQGWVKGTPVGATGSNAQGWSRTTRAQGEKVKYYSGKGNASEESVAQGICAKISKSGNVEEAIVNAFPAYLKGKKEGDEGYAEAMTAAVAKLSANPLYKDCIKKANEKFEKKEAIYIDETSPGCPDCIDPTTGQAVTSGPDGKPFKRVKDANGNCTPCPTTECYCEDEMGNQVVVDCNDPCTKESTSEGGSYQQQGAVPVQNLPEDEFALWADLMYTDANMDPSLKMPRPVHEYRVGFDPRPEANTAMAGANAAMQVQGKFVNNPGALLANQLGTQQVAYNQAKEAFNRANQYNVGQENDEIHTNTLYTKDFLDKEPLFINDYLGKVAKKKENKARFRNEKLARFVQDKRQMAENARNIALINAGTENIKFDPGSNSVYSVKTKDFSPTYAASTDAAQKMKDIMNTYGIEDENVAYKLATAARYGGQYANGGFVYSNSIFPFIL